MQRTINATKKKEIVKFLKKNPEESFTLNQIRNQVNIHIYKAELLMNQLLYEQKVTIKKEGIFTFWGIKE